MTVLCAILPLVRRVWLARAGLLALQAWRLAAVAPAAGLRLPVRARRARLPLRSVRRSRRVR